MSSKTLGCLCSGILLATCLTTSANAQEQEREAALAAGLQIGPAEIAPHWSKYDYPESVPEGAPYHIIVKGDTLWDLSGAYLGSPYLWPQIWDNNKYISDAHWIYPGDPLLLPAELFVVADRAGGPDPEGTAEYETRTTVSEVEAARLFPITEETTMFCAGRIVPDREDASFQVVGSEQGSAQYSYSDRDILYINRGSTNGVASGDVFVTQRPSYDVRHPETGKKIGYKIETTGRVRVVMVQADSATVVVEAACQNIENEDYLTPYVKPTVPLAEAGEPPDPFSLPSGKATGYVVDLDQHLDMAAAGHLVEVDLGFDTGVAPGNKLLAFRQVYDDNASSRRVLGELAVLVVRENTSLAKIMYSVDTILGGDRVEIR